MKTIEFIGCCEEKYLKVDGKLVPLANVKDILIPLISKHLDNYNIPNANKAYIIPVDLLMLIENFIIGLENYNMEVTTSVCNECDSEKIHSKYILKND